MIPRRDHRGASLENLNALLAAYTPAASRILAVDDGKIHSHLLLHAFESLGQSLTPGFSHHIAQKKYPDH
jgi:hypothetical protein